MLDPWIIEEIRRREEEERLQREQQRPMLEIRIETPEHSHNPEKVREEPNRDRGVTIIDFLV